MYVDEFTYCKLQLHGLYHDYHTNMNVIPNSTKTVSCHILSAERQIHSPSFSFIDIFKLLRQVIFVC